MCSHSSRCTVIILQTARYILVGSQLSFERSIFFKFVSKSHEINLEINPQALCDIMGVRFCSAI